MMGRAEFPRWVYAPDAVWEEIFPSDEHVIVPSLDKARVVQSEEEIPAGWTSRLRMLSDVVVEQAASSAQPLSIPVPATAVPEPQPIPVPRARRGKPPKED